MNDLRSRFTKNAEEFDSLMTLMLAENQRLTDEVKQLTIENEKLKNIIKHNEICRLW